MSSEEYILSLNNYGIAYGETIIIGKVTLNIPEKGIYVLLGPAGTGKSTLLRTLAGINQALPNLRTWGTAEYAGEPLSETDSPSLVAQNAKLLMSTVYENIVFGLPEKDNLSYAQKYELAKRLLGRAGLGHLNDKLDESVVNLPLGTQRHLAIVRTVASSPKLVMVDEPTTGVEEECIDSLLAYMKQEAERRAVLVVLHNQKQAKYLGGRTALLAGGYIWEDETTEQFFGQPQSDVAQQFVRSGSCYVPSPNSVPEELDNEEHNGEQQKETPVLPPEARKFRSDSFGPRNFLWLVKGELAGTPRPGIVADIDHDLTALKRVGITTLVSLTTKPVEQSDLNPFDIHGIHFPIKDMGVPEVDSAKAMCARVEEMIAAGHSVAYHCKAGLGRTGTMLAAQLIWRGASALEALETARRVEPRWVQSEEQVDFLQEFASAVADSEERTGSKEQVLTA